MKEQRETPIPTREYLTPYGPFRFYFNHAANSENEKTTYTADFVEVAELTRENIISAMIRQQYTVDKEASLLRKALAQEAGAQEAFETYNTFVNACKATADAPQPDETWLKADIQAFLKNRGVNYASSLTKIELLALC